MLLSLVARATARKPRPRRPAGTTTFRPSLLVLEGREVPAAHASPVAQLGPAQSAAPIAQIGSIIPITVNNVVNQAGQLLANISLGGTNLLAPLTLTTAPNPDPAAACPILNLQLGPIHLDLLGLKVDTSKICLSLTALPGPGNLLGNLLCDVSHLLDQGTPLGTILGGLTSTDLTSLTNGITGLLNGALSNITTPFGTTSSHVSAATNVLHLSLGPVDLNLLGLDVHLDNCANGPVTVDITAVPGPGNLLGNLISGLAGILDGPGLRIGQIGHQLGRIADAIDGLL
jgi:hypothetical protein